MTQLAASTSLDTPAHEAARPVFRSVHASGLSPVRFIAGSTITALIGAGLLAAVLALFNDPTWWRGFAAGAVAGLISLVLSSVPMTLLFSRSLAVVMNGYLLAGGIRAAALGAIVVLAVRVGHYPQNATVACAGVMYLFIVMGEGLVLWSMIDRSPLQIEAVPPLVNSPVARTNRDPS